MRAAACAVAFVAAAALAPAAATAPRPPLVKPATGTVGAARPGESIMQLTAALGAFDRIMPALPGSSFAAFAVRNDAVVTFRDAAETDADSILYRGPLRTLRGDRIGTRLSSVRRHWRVHATTTPAEGLRGHVELRVGRVWFVFDARKRLAGVRLGSPDALALATFR